MAKKQNNDEKIIAALDALDRTTRQLERYGSSYDEHIDNAALRGDDKSVKRLINRKVSVYALCTQLRTLKSDLELGAYSARVVAEMGKLPDVIAGCKGLLSESPNFGKLGDSLKKIFKEMYQSMDEISKLNDILDNALSPAPELSLISRLDGNSNEETSDQFKAEYAAMMERIKGKISAQPVAKPETVSEETGNIDFDGIIAEENKKK